MTAKRSVTPGRRQLLAAVHIAASDLHMADDTYRDALERVTGHRSAADCSNQQLLAMADELRRMAGKEPLERATKAAYPGRPAGQLSPQLSKVEALLADASRPWAYANGVAMRMFKVPRVQWCKPDQLQRLIAALQIDANRRKK